jgi:hypothetical protein
MARLRSQPPHNPSQLPHRRCCQAYIEEVEPTRAVERELGQSRRQRAAIPGALDFSGAAITCDAGELARGVLGAVGSAPETTAPGGRCRDGLGLALLEREACC